MIKLGLQRISQLVHPSSLPWKAIHVAGTNGKGSVCAYLASILRASSITVGRFTSPHLVHRWDSITISDQPVSREVFLNAEALIHARNAELELNCTEFELLTATAFELFTQQHVAIAVVEVGLGGRLDATNVLDATRVLCSVITKIGLDHQGLLGNTLATITMEKVGICKPGGGGVVCDASNSLEVRKLVAAAAVAAGTRPIWAAPITPKPNDHDDGVEFSVQSQNWGLLRLLTPLSGRFQPTNLSCAVAALDYIATTSEYAGITPETIARGVAATCWPGRLEWIDVSQVVGSGRGRLLVDGAHNPAAAEELAAYVDAKVRVDSKKHVIWVLAASQGKDFRQMLATLLHSGDNVVATEFCEVDGMPWVRPVECSILAHAAEELLGGVRDCTAVAQNRDVVGALRLAYAKVKPKCDIAAVVVAGSLYCLSFQPFVIILTPLPIPGWRRYPQFARR